jgi:hypothetical protein
MRWCAATVVALLVACGSGDEGRDRPRETTFEPVQLVAGIAWRTEAPLIGRRPTSEYRTAEYAVRGHDEAELAVFHFRSPEEDGAAEGGSVDDNIGRWLEQFTQPDGRPTREVAEIDEREIDGVPVTVVRARGTFSGMRGMGAAENAEGYALLGAIVEAPEGLVFFKLLGSEAAIRDAESAFESTLASIQIVHE